MKEKAYLVWQSQLTETCCVLDVIMQLLPSPTQKKEKESNMLSGIDGLK